MSKMSDTTDNFSVVLTDDDHDLYKQLKSTISKAFSDFVQNKEFVNPENKDMVMFVSNMLGGAYADFVLAFKITPWVPDLTVAIGALKCALDGKLESYMKKESSSSFADLENINHNVP